MCHGVELADTPGIEGNASAADTDNRLKGLAEQVCTNHLEALFHRRSVFLFILLHGLALQLRLDALFHIAQLTGNALDAVVVGHPHKPAARVRQMLVLQINAKVALFHAHGNAADPDILFLLMPRPGTVDGNVAPKGACIDDSHGNVSAGVPVAMAVQDALGCVPLRTGDDGIVVRGLVILVLSVAVLHGLVVVKIRRPCLAGEHIAAVAFVAHDRGHTVCGPFGVGRSVPSASAGLTFQLGQGFGDLLCRAAVEQHVVHEPHRLSLFLVDDQLLPVDAVLNHLNLIVAQQPGRQKAPAAEPPFEGEQHGLALHVRFFLGYHRQNEQDDVAGGVQRIEVFLLKQHGNGRVLLLQPAYPADAIDQITGKTADRLGDYHINFACHRILHHPLKAGPVESLRTTQPIVDIQASELPFGIAADHFTVIPLLKLNGDGLLDVIRGYTAVCGDVEDTVLLRSLRAGDNLVHARAVIGVELIPQGVLGALTLRFKARTRRLPGQNRAVLLQGVALRPQLFRAPSGLLIGPWSGINHTAVSPP